MPSLSACARGNHCGLSELQDSKIPDRQMSYPWPLPHPAPVLDQALDIALDYLEATGQAKAGDDTQHLVAGVVLAEWLQGTRHRIRLANRGIVAAEQAQASLPRRTRNLRLHVVQDLTLP